MPMCTQQDIDSLEQRITALQDIEAIETLKARYWRALDRRQPAEVARCLAPDAVIDFEGLPRYETREAFMELVCKEAGNTHSFNMHHGQNPRIRLTGENQAAGEWDIFFHGIDPASGSLLQMGGTYADTYIRQDGAWLIATSTMRQTSLLVQTTSPALASVTFGRSASG
jgi:hypothetical protein